MPTRIEEIDAEIKRLSDERAALVASMRPTNIHRRRCTLFTDGCCLKNPGGPGGWAFILRRPGSLDLAAAGSEPSTTNNRMEMMAVIIGLRHLDTPHTVKLVSDSKYVGDGITSWIKSWRRTGWKRKEKGVGMVPVKNADLWRELSELADVHTIEFEHVRGHSGHVENEQCDQMADDAARGLCRS